MGLSKGALESLSKDARLLITTNYNVDGKYPATVVKFSLSSLVNELITANRDVEGLKTQRTYLTSRVGEMRKALMECESVLAACYSGDGSNGDIGEAVLDALQSCRAALSGKPKESGDKSS